MQPAASAGASFQPEHDRVVPGDDLRADADRLLQRVGEDRAADRPRAAFDRADRRGHVAELSAATITSGFVELTALPTLRASSSVSSLRLATIASASAWRSRERSFGGVFPHALERSTRGVHRAVDVARPADGRLGERLAGRRLDELADLAVRRLRRLPVDEEPVLAPVATAIGADDSAGPSCGSRTVGTWFRRA